MAAEVVTQLATSVTVQQVSEQPFYIPMTGPAARPRRSLKHDDTFIVLDSHGDIGASAGGPDGLFNADTRYLARLEMVLDDMQPLLLGSNLRDDNSALTVDLTNSDVYRDGRLMLQKDTLHIVRSIFLWRGTAYQRIGLQNHGDQPASFDLTLLFDNDFADLFEVRGERRERRGVGSSKLLGPSDVVFEYSGLDDQSRITALHFDPRPTRLAVNSATYHFELAPKQVTSLFVAISCNKPIMQKAGAVLPRPAGASPRDAAIDGGCATIETSNNIFNEVLTPGDGRPQHADDGNAAGQISLCRHSLVFDDIRPRRPDHGAADAVGRSAHRPGRAQAARLLPGQGRRSAGRRRARQDPARNARRRDGRASRGAVRAILRQRRFDAAVRPARGPLCRTHRRRGNAGRIVAFDRGGVAMDRRSRRSRSGRLCRISARHRAGAGQSGLEGFLRRDLPRRWTPCRRLYRAGAKCRATCSPASVWPRVARAASE